MHCIINVKGHTKLTYQEEKDYTYTLKVIILQLIFRLKRNKIVSHSSCFFLISEHNAFDELITL